MSEPFARLRRFLRELKRRKVYRTAATYAVIGFVLIEAADLIFPALNIPSWAYSLVVVLILFGFPIALVLAWAFEMTPEGVRRTADAEGAEGAASMPPEERRSRSRLAVTALVALGLVGAAVAGGWYLVGGRGEPEGELRSGDRSIAVLPFENMGGGESEQFTQGVHDGLLTRLSNISDLLVISRTSVMQYEESDKAVPEIGRELNASWVVEGAVQQAGGQVQVNAQLIDTRTDAHQWAETYRRELTTENLFDVQSELTKRIARSLEAELSPEESERVERRPTDDLEAYRLYVRGRILLDQRTETGMRQAAESFHRAIEQDSAYALAWSGLADARTLLAQYGYGPADTLEPRALEAARRSLELDPELAEAHASMGIVYEEHLRDGPTALRHLRRAVELQPSYVQAHHWLGYMLLTLGRLEESFGSLERAVELDPMSPPVHAALAYAYRYSGRHREALAEARRAEELEPGYATGPFFAGITLSTMGRQQEAMDALRRVLDRTNPSPWMSAGTRAWLAIAHHRAENTRRARELLAEVERAEAFPFFLGGGYAGLGEREAALRALEEADYDSFRTFALRYDPVFDPLRDDPRYRELIRDLNRQWGLNPDGSLPDSVDVSLKSQADEW